MTVTTAAVAACRSSTFSPPAGGASIQSAFSQKYTSVADKASIKVTGEASKILEPDQITIMLGMQSQPTDVSSIAGKQAEDAGKVINAIKAAVGQESKTTVSIANSYINQYYSGPSTPSSTFTSYAYIPVTIDLDGFSEVVKKITDAGFDRERVRFAGLL